MRETPVVLLTLWMSGALDWVSVSCLKSAVRHGHEVHLYSYGDIPNVPQGVQHKDARTIIPEDEIFFYDGVKQPKLIGSPAPFSDAFRYRSQQLERGVWMDSDMYFLREIDLSAPMILAWEKPENPTPDAGWLGNLVGNAFMKLPPKSAVTTDLVRLTSKPYKMPPWISKQTRKEVLEKLQGKPFFPGAVTYATVGPVALTYYAKKQKILRDILSNHHFYPVFFRDINRLGENDEAFLASLPQETGAIHIWNSAFKRAFKTHVPDGSFAQRLKEESLDA